MQKYFSKLPAELRYKIWAYNLPRPRIVPIQFGDDSISSPSDESPRWSRGFTGCTSSAAVPVNLHVCHDSRVEALRTFRLCFGIGRQPGQVFFDPTQDILYFGARRGFMASESQFRSIMTMTSPQELASVRRLAINDDMLWLGGAPYESTSAARRTVELLMELRSRMPGLREVYFVPRDNGAGWRNDTMLNAFRDPWALMPMDGDDLTDHPRDGDGDISLDVGLDVNVNNVSANNDTTMYDDRLPPDAVLVPAGVMESARMHLQIQTAMETISEAFPDWVRPAMKIMIAMTPSKARAVRQQAAAAAMLDAPRLQHMDQTLIRRFCQLEA